MSHSPHCPARRAAWLARGLGTALLAAGLLAAAGRPAEARVHFGIGIGFPLFGWYHYAPPPVYYVPPPVYYVPPPRVYYSPPPAYAPPPGARPVSPEFQGPGGETCREYSTTVYIGGRPQVSYGTACLQPDGSWRLVD